MTGLPPGRPGMESIPPITSTDPFDPEDGTERVSAAGLHRLKERWASFLAEAGTGPEKRAVTVTPRRRQTTGTQSC